ncbi:hypothetical protein [Luteimicrobium sp. DT211]|uniref:hypothetical protein n=1 Tax=Luteimicrobium sp. DT211 TaxID=3393412 RepID=UPI003CE6BDFB
MRRWFVRVGTAFVFNVLVLLVIFWLVPAVHGGWSVLWASLVFTAATLFLKPFFHRVLLSEGERLRDTRATWLKGKLLTYGVSYVVALLIWILTVVFSSVSVSGFLWGWLVPPFIVLLGWIVYDQLDDALERKAGELYDAAEQKMRGNEPPPPPSPHV